jgi:predicted permease
MKPLAFNKKTSYDSTPIYSDMLKNYFTIAIRNIRKRPSFPFINVISLSVGITCCLLIFLLLRSEWSYDRFFSKGERIYRVGAVMTTPDGTVYNGKTPYPLANALRADFPEFESVTQIHYSRGGLVTVENDRYHEQNFIYADSVFLSVFNYEWLAGSPEAALAQPNSVVLTQALAKKYFNGKDAMGKVIKLDNTHTLKVTGIMKDVPTHTHLPFSMLISYANYASNNPNITRWNYINQGATYALLPERVLSAQLESRMPAFIAKHLEADVAKNTSYLLQPLHEIRFDTRFAKNNFTETVGKETLWILASIGVIIILIACVNFINLSSAQSIKRQKEVGMRKVLGGKKEQIVWQFLSETFVLAIVAVVLSLGFTFLLVPRLNQFLEFTELHFTFDAYVIGFLLGLTSLVGILAGLHPALVLSSYKPALALKSSISAHTKRKGYFSFGRSMVVFQFVAAYVLIIGTMVVSSQMKYFQQKDLGFVKEAILNFYINDQDEQKLALLRNELLNNPQITSVSFGKGAPTSNDVFTANFGLEGKEPFEIKVKPVDGYYKDTYGLTLKAGQWYQPKEVQKGKYEFVINETMLKSMGYQQPEEVLGKPITLWLWEAFEGTIVGVVHDFHMASLKEAIAPLVMMNLPVAFSQAGVKLSGPNLKETVQYIEKTYQQTYPEDMFGYFFLEENITQLYKREEKIETLFMTFSGMAIFIACLGLLGLSSHAAIRRTKEIGIRKVLGASVSQVVFLLSKEFAALVLVAFLIAFPLAWYAMNQWLQNFAYGIEIGIRTLVGAGMLVLFLALLAISYQSIKAAMANPVKSLRSE